MGMASVVYLLDDDEAVRESVAAILTLHDITVHAYGLASAFLAACFNAERACLLIDIHLEDGNGVETLSELRRRGVKLPAILMSGRIQHQGDREFEGLEPFVFLEKPIDGDAVALLLDDLMPENDR
jgi:FixJ family two-component response regulator